MKRILLLLVLLCAPLLAQRTASNWGDQILLGTEFINDPYTSVTDSIKLRTSALRDTVLADTLYSGVLDINDWIDGIFSVKAWLDSLGGGADSVAVEMRYVVKFKKKNPSTNAVTYTHKFGLWKPIFAIVKYDSLYSIGIAQSDSSWHQPYSGRQYRVYDKSVTTDTSLIYLTDYLR